MLEKVRQTTEKTQGNFKNLSLAMKNDSDENGTKT